MIRLVVFLVIITLGWWLSQPRSTETAPTPVQRKTSTPNPMTASKPRASRAAAATPDDLTEIVGIGPAWAKRLNELGIWSFKQLAEQNEKELSQRLPKAVAARLEREGWIEQAKQLAKR